MAKYKKKLDADIRCPLEYGLTIFGGKSGEYPQKLYKELMNSQTAHCVGRCETCRSHTRP
jgi:hypothetical protein